MKRIRLILCFIALFSFGTSFGQNEKPKIMYITGFAKEVTWSPMPKGNFVIGVIGNPVLALEMKKIASTQPNINGHTIEVKSFETVSNMPNCQILYIATSKSILLGQVLTTLGKANTLVITDSPGLCKKGAGINFVMNGTKYEINKANILKQGLTFNDGLLTQGIPVN